jgi:hypothetical protein
MEYGAISVEGAGPVMMLVLYADIWDTHFMVCISNQGMILFHDILFVQLLQVHLHTQDIQTIE